MTKQKFRWVDDDDGDYGFDDYHHGRQDKKKDRKRKDKREAQIEELESDE